MIENIDGYVSKDSLYRLISNYRRDHFLLSNEENVVKELTALIKDMPSEKENNNNRDDACEQCQKCHWYNINSYNDAYNFCIGNQKEPCENWRVSFKDENGKYRSVYDILSDIANSDIWKENIIKIGENNHAKREGF